MKRLPAVNWALLTILVVVLGFAGAVPARAGDVIFGWDAYTDPVATGFKLYCARTANVQVTATNLQVTITPVSTVQYTGTGMATGKWYCALIAFNADSESPKSNEVSVTMQLPAPAHFKEAAGLLAGHRGDAMKHALIIVAALAWLITTHQIESLQYDEASNTYFVTYKVYCVGSYGVDNKGTCYFKEDGSSAFTYVPSASSRVEPVTLCP